MSIYLFKAARRPTYRRENLHLLAPDRGTVVDAQYRVSYQPHDQQAGPTEAAT